MMRKLKGVLDTSFWSLTVHLRLQGYLDDVFQTPLYVPRKVREEIFSRENAPAGRIYPYQKEFEVFADADRFEIKEPSLEMDRLGPGESKAISLAKELDAAILVNESTGYRVAKEEVGLLAVHVPLYIFLLSYDGIISKEKAVRSLDEANYVTPDSFTETMKQLLDKLPGGETE